MSSLFACVGLSNKTMNKISEITSKKREKNNKKCTFEKKVLYTWIKVSLTFCTATDQDTAAKGDKNKREYINYIYNLFYI